MILDSTLKKLQVSLTSSITTANMPVVVDWVDTTVTTFTPGISLSNTNGVTLTDILVAPASSTQRKVNSITISNQDTAAKVVEVYLIDNVTSYRLIYVTLQVNETLSYTDTKGWNVLDTSGAIKGVGPTGATGATGSSGTTGSIGMPGLDGEQGEIGDPIPGPRGTAGLNGSTGPQGPIGFSIDGIDGDDGQPIPGPQGIQGTNGTNGTTGPQGPIGWAIDGEDGVDGIPIPGPRGATGAQGSTGPSGPGTTNMFIIEEASQDEAWAMNTSSSVPSSLGGFIPQIITDSTDIALAVAATGTQSNVGSPFSVNIPANGIIRLACFSGQILNNATATSHITVFGIRIGTTNYWVNVGNVTPTASSSSTFSTAATANLATTYVGADYDSNNNTSSPLLDVAACGVPTGVQTVQLIAGYITTQTTLKGTVKQTRVMLEIIGY